jgi:hypothetical protein
VAITQIFIDLNQSAAAAFVTNIFKISEEDSMLAFPPRQRPWPAAGVVAQWWRRWIGARADVLLEVARLGAGKLEYLTRDVGPPAVEIPDVPRYSYDASLLFRRMTLLQIDRDELAREDPLLLRELQGICTLCGSKEECVQDLTREIETGEPQDWQDYCPNAATLNALGAVQNCPRAAQYLRTSHSG